MSNSDLVESRSFDYIPENERNGTVANQAQLWFMVNATLIAMFTGAVVPLYKLDLFWTLIAIVLGSVFGTLFQAFHGAQGPRMGLPQMIESRVHRRTQRASQCSSNGRSGLFGSGRRCSCSLQIRREFSAIQGSQRS